MSRSPGHSMPLSSSAFSTGRLLFVQILSLTFCFAGPSAFGAETLPEPAKNLRHLQALRAGVVFQELGWTLNEDFVPRPVRAMLTRLKHDMRERIVAAMGQDADAEADPGSIEAAIARRFERDGLNPHRGDDYLRFARRFLVRAAEAPGHPELRVVTLAIGIPLGDDTSLYIFERRPSGWELVLSSEVNGYPSVMKAQSHFRYKFSPFAGDGSWFVVTASVNNRAASAWQGVTYTAQMAGDDPYHPRVLVREEHTICLIGFDDEGDAFELVPSARGFRISFPHAFAGQGIMAWAVYSYDIEDGRVRRSSRECHLNRARGRRIRCP